jgi:translocator protein
VRGGSGKAFAMDLGRLGFAVLPVAAAAGLGGLGARRAPAIYQELRKPRWAPPASAFAPVWSTLYVAIAAAGWRISASASATTRVLHLAQLALNGGWPGTFFGIRDKRASLVIIALLDLSLGLEVARLRREDRGAAALLVPYLAWCGFATALNAAVSGPESHD